MLKFILLYYEKKYFLEKVISLLFDVLLYIVRSIDYLLYIEVVSFVR